MSYLKYLCCLFLIPFMSYALPNLTEKSNYFAAVNNTPVLSDSLYLADNYGYSSSSGMRTISQGRYIGGGVASIFLAFGIGHAIQGRWKERGWIHTAVQSGAFVTYIGSLMFMETFYKNNSLLGVLFGGYIVLVGIKVWEMVDVWMLPDSIKIISSSQKIGASSLYSYKPNLNVPSIIALQWQF